jgi:hypothetical protein
MCIIKRFIRSVAKLHIVQVRRLSFDFCVTLGVFCTFTLELYEPAGFFTPSKGEDEACAVRDDFLTDSGNDVTDDVFAAEDFDAFVGVSSVLSMCTFPPVNCSAFSTSAGKFVITLLLERYLSAMHNRNNCNKNY